MLKYAEKHDKALLEQLDFRIIFMGASVDAMAAEPFSHYPEKLIHYKQLGLEETVDHHWKRDRKLKQDNLKTLVGNITVKKKVWTGVSCSIFEQILQHYQESSTTETLAFRDNPSREGDTDYFRVAEEIQRAANKIAVPSEASVSQVESIRQKVVLVGHGPMEDWLNEAQHINNDEIIQRLSLDSQLPIIVYAGSYGDHYQSAFKRFLTFLPDVNAQFLIVPHPRFKGGVETKLCEGLKYEFATISIIGEWENNSSKKARTIEALSIADIVVTSDATSTIVFQANALGKKVLYINSIASKVSDAFFEKELLYKISDRDDFLKSIESEIKSSSISSRENIFTLLGIPKNGAKRLWEEFKRQ